MTDKRDNWIVAQEAEQKMKAAILGALRELFEGPMVPHKDVIDAVEGCEVDGASHYIHGIVDA